MALQCLWVRRCPGCRLAQAEAGAATSAGRQECLRLCCAVLKEDADTLAACTRNEWTGADGTPGATSGLCAPALWQARNIEHKRDDDCCS